MNALVTGASSGIGKELALLLAERGYHVVLVARREPQLRELAARCQHGGTILPMDLAHPGAASELYRQLQERNLEIEVLVNNAGFGRADEVIRTDLAMLEEMNALNVGTLVSLCRLLGSDMAQRGHGSILNVGSLAAYVAIPQMANYAATKAFVSSFTRGFRYEMAPYGVQVSLLSPGPTRTEFGLRAREGADMLADLPGLMSAHEVAKQGLEALFADVGEVIPGGLNKTIRWATNLLPTSVITRLAHLWASRGRSASQSLSPYPGRPTDDPERSSSAGQS